MGQKPSVREIIVILLEVTLQTLDLIGLYKWLEAKPVYKNDDDLSVMQEAVRSLKSESNDKEKVERLGPRSKVLSHGLTDLDMILVLASGVLFAFSQSFSHLIVRLKAFPPT